MMDPQFLPSISTLMIFCYNKNILHYTIFVNFYSTNVFHHTRHYLMNTNTMLTAFRLGIQSEINVRINDRYQDSIVQSLKKDHHRLSKGTCERR